MIKAYESMTCQYHLSWAIDPLPVRSGELPTEGTGTRTIPYNDGTARSIPTMDKQISTEMGINTAHPIRAIRAFNLDQQIDPQRFGCQGTYRTPAVLNSLASLR